MTNLERWLTRFSAGAATTYTWQVAWRRTPSGPRRLLRAVLTMQSQLDHFPSMLGPDMRHILAAADDDPHADQALRKTLLELCGVEERPIKQSGASS
jgi:hypothetical protein